MHSRIPSATRARLRQLANGTFGLLRAAARFRRAHEAAHDLAFDLLGKRDVEARAREQRGGIVARVDARRLDARRSESRLRRAVAMNSLSSSAPATHPVHSSMLAFTASGSPPRTTTSLTANRPPGFSTRNASASTCRLSPERLITQFEMITSTVFDGSGIDSMWPLRNSTFVAPAFSLFSSARREHLVGHVEAVRLARRADALRREQHVDAAARPEVEHGLAFVQFGERRRVAAAERGEQAPRREGRLSHRRRRGRR